MNTQIFDTKDEPVKASPKSEEIDIHSNVYPPPIINWEGVTLLGIIHIAAVPGFYAIITGQAAWQTIVFGVFGYVFATIGVFAGSHRLWSHRSYKAKLPLRIILAVAHTCSYQLTIFNWVRDHRLHHKYSETLADPSNIRRGFFFAHVGWLLCRKHDAVLQKGKNIDMSDIKSDSVVMFQKKYYQLMIATFVYILPTIIPHYLWGESFLIAFTVNAFKQIYIAHSSLMINSVAHSVGNKPYDKSIDSTENKFVSYMSLGEGWHNYHHTFPWDYKANELGTFKFNLTTAFIDLMSKIGLAYDLKTAPKHIVDKRILRTGDGSHTHNNLPSDLNFSDDTL